jgi:cation transport regulator ChaC
MALNDNPKRGSPASNNQCDTGRRDDSVAADPTATSEKAGGATTAIPASAGDEAIADTDAIATESSSAVWDAELQIYTDGVIPEEAHVREWLLSQQQESAAGLWIFGYGSLCWNPGQDGDSVLPNPRVSARVGLARGYRRCWAQKSTDHRGVPDFPGIVCTLLKQEELESVVRTRKACLSRKHQQQRFSNGTLGRVYLVPPDLIDQCLKELDFREKGGYARDLIDVILFEEEPNGESLESVGECPDDPDGALSTQTAHGKVVQALLYRGALDNPAIWRRALNDLTFAAGKGSTN